MANKLVSSQIVEAEGLESPFQLAGSRLALSAHPDILSSEEERANTMERGMDLKHYPEILEFSGNPYRQINNPALAQMHQANILHLNSHIRMPSLYNNLINLPGCQIDKKVRIIH